MGYMGNFVPSSLPRSAISLVSGMNIFLVSYKVGVWHEHFFRSAIMLVSGTKKFKSDGRWALAQSRGRKILCGTKYYYNLRFLITHGFYISTSMPLICFIVGDLSHSNSYALELIQSGSFFPFTSYDFDM